MILFIVVAALVAALLFAIPAWAWYDGSSYDRMWSRRLAVVAAAVWLALTAAFGWLSFGTEATVTIRVEGKERIAEGNDGKWMIYAADGQTFEDTDAWFHGKTDSTDLYRKLKVGHTYRCKVNGVRFTVLSWYRNVLRCDEAA